MFSVVLKQNKVMFWKIKTRKRTDTGKLSKKAGKNLREKDEKCVKKINENADQMRKK